MTGQFIFIPATDTGEAIRAYLCGCSYRFTGGWAHCNEHTTNHGVLTAATISRQAAKEAASR